MERMYDASWKQLSCCTSQRLIVRKPDTLPVNCTL
jgi:hypothetical protein